MITSIMYHIKLRNNHQTIRIHQKLRILPLWYRLTRRLHNWKMNIVQKWWHVDSHTWDCLTKIIWTTHQDRTQCRHGSGLKQLLQIHQYTIHAMASLWEDLLFYTTLSKYTLSLKNNRSHIMITLTIREIHRPPITLETTVGDTEYWHLCKAPMPPQAYKAVNTHANEISGSNILCRLLHAHTPNIGGMSSDVKSDLATLELKKG